MKFAPLVSRATGSPRGTRQRRPADGITMPTARLRCLRVDPVQQTRRCVPIAGDVPHSECWRRRRGLLGGRTHDIGHRRRRHHRQPQHDRRCQGVAGRARAGGSLPGRIRAYGRIWDIAGSELASASLERTVPKAAPAVPWRHDDLEGLVFETKLAATSRP